MWDTSWTFEKSADQIIKKPKTPVMLYLFNDQEKPAIITDSVKVWPTYYDNYTFDDAGKAIDSVFVEPDSTINRILVKKVFFDNSNTFREDFEIMRYITPYGNGLDLGDGFRWVMDVSDFAQLLSGKVYIHAPCGGWGDQYSQNSMEDLELTFDFIEGTPPRNLVKTTKLWDFNGIVYDKNIENYLTPYTYTFNKSEQNALLKIIQTGHGFGGTDDNCAEFCNKTAFVKVDGTQRFSKSIWRECGNNPVYPQGGTWIFDRSNWCPGSEVAYHDYDISKYITSGAQHIIDYDMEYYDLKWKDGGNTRPNWVIRGFLFTYGSPNFVNDARVINILTPNSDSFYNRSNPWVGNPSIVIQNSGSSAIESVNIKYGNDANNLASANILLDKPLEFMEQKEIELPYNNWFKVGKSSNFIVEITEVNGKPDDYEFNNKGQSTFISNFTEIPNNFSIELVTNNSDVLGINSPYSYAIYDQNGTIVAEKKNTLNSSKYNDIVNLPDGYYSFTIINPYGYGLGFWVYNSQAGLKNGSLRFLSNSNTILHSFPLDWGNYYTWNFKTSTPPKLLLNVDDNQILFGKVIVGEKSSFQLKLFPENSKGIEITDINLPLSSNKKFTITKESSTSEPNPRKLELGDTLTLTIEFEPLSAGNKTSNLIITSTDTFNSPTTISLNGIGANPSSVEGIPDNTQINMKTTTDDNINFKIEIYNEGLVEIEDIFITDITGTVVPNIFNNKTFDGNNTLYIDGNSLSVGMYFVILRTNGGLLINKISLIK